MPRSGWFERRLLIALVLFALVPTVLVVGTATLILREAVSLQTTPAGWERLGETGRVLLEQAEASGDAEMVAAAESHREELTVSIQQAQRWGYLNRRILGVLPWIAAVFFVIVVLLGVRWARLIARGLARPIGELVGWSDRIARGEPLPPPTEEEREEAGEFGVLRESLRSMAHDLELSRVRALEAARVRAAVALARGVAHELKNALTPLRLAVRVLQSNRSLDVAQREPLEVIDVESRRLEELARAFSQFGRPPDGPRSPIDLAELLQYLGRTYLPPEVRFDLRLADPAITIDGYYDSLSRAFANLMLNAAEAMGGAGGDLHITLDRATDGRVEVRIVDSGPGLPAGFEDRAWDPDFTTKARGTGLGLALVRQTILAHDGEITAANHAGGGAEFRIVLPSSTARRDRGGPALPEAAATTAIDEDDPVHMGMTGYDP
jgi:signal transduction histidine kinase